MIHPRQNVSPRDNRPSILKATIRILLAVLPLAVSPAIAAQNLEPGDAGLRKLMDIYAEAVNKADANLGSQVWCGSDEDSITNPGGHWEGPRQIKAFLLF